jgi:hypothetical protein
LFPLTVIPLLAFASIACSSGSVPIPRGTDPPDASVDTGVDAGDPDVCEPLYETDADLTTPKVNFDKTVLPIFEKGCGIAGSTCHGAPNVTFQQRPYLGEFDGGTDAAAVIEGLVGVASSEDPQMNLVEAGDPTQSFLMHKLDGDQCNLVAACAASQTNYTNCGTGMPYLNSALPAATRDTVRRWIAQGGKSED